MLLYAVSQYLLGGIYLTSYLSTMWHSNALIGLRVTSCYFIELLKSTATDVGPKFAEICCRFCDICARVYRNELGFLFMCHHDDIYFYYNL